MKSWHVLCNNMGVDAHSTPYVRFGLINPGMMQSQNYDAYCPPVDVASQGSHPTPWAQR